MEAYGCAKTLAVVGIGAQLRQRFPAVDGKKEDLPKEPKQKAYSIGRQKDAYFPSIWI